MVGYLTNIWRSEPFRLILVGSVIAVLVVATVLGADGMKRAETALQNALNDGYWLVKTLEQEGPVLGQRRDPSTTATRGWNQPLSEISHSSPLPIRVVSPSRAKSCLPSRRKP